MSDAIAIVGMAGRFPGARNIDEFWELLRSGRDALTHFTDDELIAAGLDRHQVDDPSYVRAGMVLDDIESFDADFFGIPAPEAEMMDPQQRILLETTWEALEEAGHAPGGDARVAVYAGARMSEYMLFRQSPPDLFGHTGETPLEGFRRLLVNDKDYIATRLAYLLDLRGPAVTVQTACSTSLVAVHLGCQSLLNHECDVAVAGGVSLRVPQRAGYFFGEGMIYSPDGRTRPFDAEARGTIFGNGAGVVVLKRLADALADGNLIHAVIAATAVNNDGAAAKSAFTAPSLDGQVRVVAEALAAGSLDPASISYVEAHGTGTAVGDPIEIAALTEAFRTPSRHERKCAIGSVKSNIGHLVQAAGVAGLIKTALMLRHRTLVPSANFTTPNPLIDFERSPFAVSTTTEPWPGGPEPRRAGVSAFGFGGTNAHVVMQEAPGRPERPAAEGPWVLPLSAKSDAALEELRERYDAALAAAAGEVCFTAQTARAHFGEARLAVAGSTADELREALRTAPVQHGARPARVGFLFTGQGSQYPGMGRRLYETEEVFREAFDACAAAVDFPLHEVIDSDRIVRTEYAQPAITAVEISLVSLWRSWGLEPSVVLGHSVGEIAAAWAAGAMDLASAMSFARERGRLMETTRPGAMLGVFAPVEEVGDYTIAACNGPLQTVLTGDADTMARAAETLQRRGIATRPLPGTYAFHSPAMDAITDGLAAAAPRMRRPAATFVSSMTAAAETDLGPAYWSAQARRPVRFAEALTVARHHCDVLLEIGPDGILAGLAGDGVASLRRGQDDREQLRRALAAMYSRGVPIRWNALHRERPSRVALPGYPFQRRRFWIDEPRREVRRPASNDAHPLLGPRVPSPLREVQFDSHLHAGIAPFARDHWVYGTRPLVAVGQLEMMRAAAGVSVIENFVVEQALLLDEIATHVQTVVSPQTDGTSVITIFSRRGDESSWTQHSSARSGERLTDAEQLDFAAIRSRCPEAISSAAIHAAKRAKGADIGPAFDIVECAWRGQGEALVDVHLREEDPLFDRYGAYPGVLDSGAQCGDLTLDRPDPDHLFLPVVIERAAFFGPTPRRVWTYIRRREDASGDAYGVDVRIADREGHVLVALDGFFFKRATPATLRRVPAETQFEVDWVPTQLPPASFDWSGTWMILGDGDRARDLAARIGERGGRVLTVAAPLDTPDPLRGVFDFRPFSAATLATVQSMAGEDSPLWFVTSGAQATGRDLAPLVPEAAQLWGFARALRREQPSLRCRSIDLDPAGGVEPFLSIVESDPAEDELAIRAGTVFVPRLRPVRKSEEAPAPYRVVPGANRTVDGLQAALLTRRPPGHGEVEIEIVASGLNFRDAFNATGRLEGPIGYECSGIVSSCGEGVETVSPGDEVMALAHHSVATHVTVDARFVVRKPSRSSFAAAAGVPVAFLTAAWGLIERARLQRGETVLIHTAAGGVGQAAVRIAQMIGATIVSTASRAKWQTVRALGVERVLDSRKPGFGAEVRADVVLNTLGNEFIDENFSTLRPGGRLIELGHGSVVDLERMEALASARGIELIHFHTAEEAAARPERMRELFTDLGSWLESGALRPVPHRVYPVAQMATAFETILRGEHTGKLVIRHRPAPEGSVVRPDASYLITGGTGAVGLEMARHLASRGARHLVLMSRRPPSGDALLAVEKLTEAGVTVRSLIADVANGREVEQGLRTIDPPLAGVIHAAGTIDDGTLPQQTWERFEKVLAPKVHGARNLHESTARLPLDFFVLVSSIAGVWGNAGQASYAAANAFLDQLAHARRQQGLTALSIDYGLWRGAGMGATLSEDVRRRRAESGLTDLDPAAAWSALTNAIREDRTQIAVAGVDVARYVEQFASLPSLFAGMAPRLTQDHRPPAQTQTAPPPRNEEELREAVRLRVASLSRGTIGPSDLETPLPQLGLDSLTVLLLRGRLIGDLGQSAALPVIRYLEGHGIATLARMMFERQSAALPPVPSLSEVSRAVPALPAEVSPGRALVCFRAEGSRTPVVLVPPAARTMMNYASMIESWDPERPLYGINHYGFDGQTPPHDSVTAMAAAYAHDIRGALGAGPVIVGGVCFGAHVAVELAAQLRDAGVAVPAVVAVDYYAPWPRLADLSAGAITRYYSGRVLHHLRHWRSYPALLLNFRNRHRQALMEEHIATPIAEMTHAHAKASLNYRARRVDVPVVLVLNNSVDRVPVSRRWGFVTTGPVSTIVVPDVTHEDLAGPRSGPLLGRVLSAALAGIDSATHTFRLDSAP